MARKHFILLLMILSAVFITTGCGAAVELHAEKNGGVTVKYQASFGQAFMDVMKSLAGNDTGPLFDTDAIEQELGKAGMAGAQAVSSDGKSLSLSVPLAADRKDPVSASGCIVRTAHSMTLTLSYAKLSSLYSVMPETIKSYIDLFMAPVFTGETMTKDEYRDLAASVYGKPLGDEIATAKITIILYTPEGTRKAAEIPLMDVLTASKPLAYAISW